MKRILVTFGGKCYDATIGKTAEAATKLGADEFWCYDDKWLLEHDFYRLNKWLWNYPEGLHPASPRAPRGMGWFCWKPFVIMQALEHCQPGDVVCYVDADTYPIANFSCLYDICARDGGIMLFAAQGHGHEKWCKRDCFMVMGQDEEKWRFTQAGVARFMLFQKGPWLVTQFLCEWLAYCLNKPAQTFEPSTYAPEYPELSQHRTEQAIMTNLAHKYGLRLYREACQFGDGALAEGVDADLYPTLFHQVGKVGNRADYSGSAYRNIPV